MKKLLGLAAAVASIASLTACNTDQTGPSELKCDDNSCVVATITNAKDEKQEVKLFAEGGEKGLYERFLSTSAGQQKIYDRIRREVIIEGFKKNSNYGYQSYDIIKQKLKSKVESLEQEYKDKYKDTYKDELKKLWQTNGAKDLEDYVTYYILIDEVISSLDKTYKTEYEKADGFDSEKPTWKLTSIQEKEIRDYAELYNPLDISHILVKTGGSLAKPEITQEQGAKLAKVCEALVQPDAKFSEIASAYSEDTGSAKKDGHLGLMDVTTSFVNEFKHNTYAFANNQITTVFEKTGKANSPVWKGVTFVKSATESTDLDAWKGSSTSDVGCQNLGDKAITNDAERNALYTAIFGKTRMGNKMSSNGQDLLVTRSEHGIHFIKINNLTEWNAFADGKGTAVANKVIAQIKSDLANKNIQDDADYVYSPSTILKSYRDKYATDYYWNLFVNGKIGGLNVIDKDGRFNSSDIVGIATDGLTIRGLDIDKFFNADHDIKREYALENDRLSYTKALMSWRTILNTDGYTKGYNQDELGSLWTHRLTWMSDITTQSNWALNKMSLKYKNERN